MKKVFLTLFLVLSVLLISCNKPAPSEPSADNTATPTASATVTVNLNTPTITLTPGNPDEAVLFFSEYAEGTSFYRAIEIYNGSLFPANLTGVAILMYANGSTTPNISIPLSGSLGAGQVYVVKSASAVPVDADLITDDLSFNGNDAVVLMRGAVVLDSIGRIGEDPGVEWGAGDTSTADNTLKRKCGIIAGDSDPYDLFNPADEWIGFPIDTFSGFGAYDCGIPSPTPTNTVIIVSATVTPTVTQTEIIIGTATPTATATVVPVMFFSEYVEGSSNNKALEIYNSSNFDADLSQASIQIYANGSTIPTININLSGVISAGGLFVIAHSSAAAELLAYVYMSVNNLSFNGNDAVVLSFGGTVLDIIGQIGVDPGSYWGSGQETTMDKTLKRKCFVTQGDTDGSDMFNPALEWAGYPMNTFSGLGTYDCGPDEPTPTLTHTHTITMTHTVTPTVTATATVTATPTLNIVTVDNFNDNNLISFFSEYWNPKIIGNNNAVLSTEASDHDSYALKVSGTAYATIGTEISGYSGYFGTVTVLSNIGVDIKPVKFIKFMGKFDLNTIQAGSGNPAVDLYVKFSTPNLSIEASNITNSEQIYSGVWHQYVIDLDTLDYTQGNKDALFGFMGSIEITARIHSAEQNANVHGTFMLDDVYFSE